MLRNVPLSFVVQKSVEVVMERLACCISRSYMTLKPLGGIACAHCQWLWATTHWLTPTLLCYSPQPGCWTSSSGWRSPVKAQTECSPTPEVVAEARADRAVPLNPSSFHPTTVERAWQVAHESSPCQGFLLAASCPPFQLR